MNKINNWRYLLNKLIVCINMGICDSAINNTEASINQNKIASNDKTYQEELTRYHKTIKISKIEKIKKKIM